MKNVHKTILSAFGLAGILISWGIVYANMNNDIEHNTKLVDKHELQITELEKVDVRREEQYENILKAIEKLTVTIEKLHQENYAK